MRFGAVVSGVLLLTTAIHIAAQPSSAQTSDPAANLLPAEREVFLAELARETATNASDFAAVERLADDDFIQVTTQGITDRATRIANSGRTAAGTPRTKSDLVYRDVRVKIYGETAVLTASRSWVWEPDGQKVSERTVKVWVKRLDGWKIALTAGVPASETPQSRP